MMSWGQCAGTNRWRLYRGHAGTRTLPVKDIIDYDYVCHVPGEVSRDIRMEPGDVLYVPRGTMHDAYTEHGDSLHLTFSLVALTVGDLMMRTVQLAMEEDMTLRAAIAYDMRAPRGGRRRDRRAYGAGADDGLPARPSA